MKIKYIFSSKLWQYKGAGGWHFVSLPKKLSKEIRATYKIREEGWGRLRVSAQVGDTRWQTAIWFDTKADVYLLALKADVRKIEKIEIGTTIRVTLLL